jgi:hypothetical protein
MARLAERLLGFELTSTVLSVSDSDSWVWHHSGLGVHRDLVPWLYVCGGLAFDSSRAEPTWSGEGASSGHSFPGFPVVRTGLS